MSWPDGYLLGLETATSAASIAVLDPRGEPVAELSFRARRTMAERLTPLVGELLRSVDLTPADLSALAVGLGPGSFTSLRVGLATAKGLALGGSPEPLPVIGIGSLETLAAAAPLNERQPVCAVIAAPKRHLYCALYARRGDDAFNCLFGPDLLGMEHLAERLEATGQRVAVAGLIDDDTRGVLHHAGATILPAIYGLPRAAIAAWLGWHRLRRGERHDLATLTPQYVHPSEAEVRFGRTFARPTGPDADD